MSRKALSVILSLAALTVSNEICHADSGWSVLPTGFTTRIQSLFCIDCSTVFACGRNGLVAKTTTGGDTWEVTIIDTSTTFSSIWFTESGNGYICGYSLRTYTAALYMTTNMGASWDLIKVGGNNTGYTALCFTDSTDGYLGMTVGTNGAILNTTDAGQTWTTHGGIGYVRAFHFASMAIGLAVGQGGLVYRTTNAGSSWDLKFQLPDASLYDFYSVFFSDLVTAFAAGDNGYLYKSTDAGESWARTYNSSHSRRFTCLWFTDDATGYVVGDSGMIMKTTDAGVSWEPQRSATAEYLASISFCDQNVGFAAGSNGVVVKTTSGGVVDVEAEPRGTPTDFILAQSYPNPFNPITTFEYTLPHQSYVTLKVYSVLGEEVATVVEGDHSVGTFKKSWDASALSSGVYFYRLTAGGFVQTRGMVVMK